MGSNTAYPQEIGFAITNYSVVDPTAAPPGKNVLTLTTMLPYECYNQWRWAEPRETYRQQKWQIAEILLDRAEEILPGLISHIEFMEIGTPQTIKAFTLNPQGSILGWSQSLEQNVLNLPEQQTPIPNLWLAGAWTFPGGGQQNVLHSGYLAAQGVLENFEKPPITTP